MITNVKIIGTHCQSCKALLEEVCLEVPGVKKCTVNFETGEDTSRTVFLAPRSWAPEWLQGWVAGHHEVLEAMFGTATVREESDA